MYVVSFNHADMISMYARLTSQQILMARWTSPATENNVRIHTAMQPLEASLNFLPKFIKKTPFKKQSKYLTNYLTILYHTVINVFVFYLLFSLRSSNVFQQVGSKDLLLLRMPEPRGPQGPQVVKVFQHRPQRCSAPGAHRVQLRLQGFQLFVGSTNVLGQQLENSTFVGFVNFWSRTKNMNTYIYIYISMINMRHHFFWICVGDLIIDHRW